MDGWRGVLLGMLLLEVFFVIILVACWHASLIMLVFNKLFLFEIFGAIIALEMTKEKGWNRTWLECDFTLVIHAFTKPSIVPWQFFFLSHIFREANSYAYKLVSFGVSSRTTTFWLDSILSFVKEEFLRK
ncbi:hypothetical protein HKD37_17G049014 [Glycine soja]